MKRIENIIQTSSNQIKKILLEEAKKFNDFPKTMMGIKDSKYVENKSYIAKGIDTRSRGIAIPKPGIVIYNDNKFWTENYFVLMLPDGLYQFRESIFITSQDGKPTDNLEQYPNWESKNKGHLDYLIHGKKALEEMRKLLKREQVSAHNS
ncbi:hypothetical protein KAR52_03705 [Candidatus Pacearchaeota archaeon]|nr:hypothetical protein [Candidatus Pacearchaeota archaeon]